MGSKYYIGVDGGGTSTKGVISDSRGNVFRTTAAGPSNVVSVKARTFKKNMSSFFKSLLGDVTPKEIGWLTLGLAGTGRKEEKSRVEKFLRDYSFENFTVLTDGELQYFSVFGESQGILLSAGTGSICIAKNPAGTIQSIGGWGFLLGDDGSGYDIGRRALREALKWNDLCLKPSEMTKAIMEKLGVKEPYGLITAVNSSKTPQTEIASLADIVFRFADKKDSNAKSIVDYAVKALLNLAILGLEVVSQPPPIKISLYGGVFEGDSPVASSFRQKADDIDFEFEYIEPEMCAAAAGVVHSLRSAGEKPSEKLLEKLAGVVV